MLEFKAPTNTGVPHLCEATREEDDWAIAIVYAYPRSGEEPYIAHLVSPEEVETVYIVKRDPASARLTFKHSDGPAVSEELETWLKTVTDQYDTALEGLGE